MSAVAISPVSTGSWTLRSLRREDLPATLEWRNHEDSRRWFHSKEAIAWEAHVAWFERYEATSDDFVFILDEGTTPVAQVALRDVTHESAELGRCLVSPDHRGRGLAATMLTLCLRVAREQLGLSRVWLEVVDGNDRAIASYRRAGFAPAELPCTPGSTAWVTVLT